MRGEEVKNITIRGVRFDEGSRTIYIQYSGTQGGRRSFWGRTEQIESDKEWFERRLKGK